MMDEFETQCELVRSHLPKDNWPVVGHPNWVINYDTDYDISTGKVTEAWDIRITFVAQHNTICREHKDRAEAILEAAKTSFERFLQGDIS